MHIFGLFLTPVLLKTIKGAYEGTKRTASSDRIWKELTLDELWIWLGIVSYTGREGGIFCAAGNTMSKELTTACPKQDGPLVGVPYLYV
jgi:hypothetical protein